MSGVSGVSGPVAAPGRRVFSAARRRDPLTILTSNPLSRELHVIVLWITSLVLAKTSISYSIPDFHYISSDAQTFDFCACPQCLCWGRPKHHEDIRPARPPRRRWSRTHSACCGNIASINLISLVLVGLERTRAKKHCHLVVPSHIEPIYYIPYIGPNQASLDQTHTHHLTSLSTIQNPRN